MCRAAWAGGRLGALWPHAAAAERRHRADGDRELLRGETGRGGAARRAAGDAAKRTARWNVASSMILGICASRCSQDSSICVVSVADASEAAKATRSAMSFMAGNLRGAAGARAALGGARGGRAAGWA